MAPCADGNAALKSSENNWKQVAVRYRIGVNVGHLVGLQQCWPFRSPVVPIERCSPRALALTVVETALAGHTGRDPRASGGLQASSVSARGIGRGRGGQLPVPGRLRRR
jgi:hypothetical protein